MTGVFVQQYMYDGWFSLFATFETSLREIICLSSSHGIPKLHQLDVGENLPAGLDFGEMHQNSRLLVDHVNFAAWKLSCNCNRVKKQKDADDNELPDR